MNKKRLCLGVAAALLSFFLACEVMGPKSGVNSGPDGKAAVRIAIAASSAQGRTVAPAVGLEKATAWELWGRKSPDPQTLLEDLSGTTETVYLETGTWDFTVKGYNNDGLILQGDLTNKTIILEGPNDLSFMATPLMEGDGTFKITINLPAGHGITRADVLKDGTMIHTVTPVADSVVFENSYAAGNYYFSIRLYKDSDLYGVVSELAQLRANLPSEKTYALTREDLNFTYVILYHLDGGDFDNGVENPAYYRSTDADVILPIPARTGYEFGGWHSNIELTGSPVALIPQSSLEDMDFYALWNPETYTVTFKSNDGTDDTLDTKTVTVPETTIGAGNFPVNPTRTGHTFTGWNTAPAGTGSGFIATTTVSGDITVYAQWTGETYTVTFKSNDNTDVTLHTKTVTVPATTIGAANFPADPTRTEYNFAGWNTTPAGSGNSFTASTTVNANMTVYARWTAAPPSFYTVIFKLNDGTETTWAAKIVTPPVDTIIVGDFPTAPSRTDYNFAGWNTAANGLGTSFTVSTIVNADITVYAQWTATVTFKSNDGTDTTLNTKTVTMPATTIPEADFPADPTRTGYNFAGWNTATNGSGNPFTASTTVSGDITVYAQWIGETYTVLFKSNDGTDTTLHTETVTVPATTIATANFPADPTRAGYNFAGWNIAPTESGSAFTASIPVNSDMTVYARWTGALITLLNSDAGDGAFSQETFTISKSGINGSQTIGITDTSYTNPRWLVDRIPKGTEMSITISAADYGLGGHNLTLIISKNGVSWSKEISFTVVN
jgi:uncharacterized repeat protein (TIGR02543 family)